MKQRIHIYGLLFIMALCLGACVDEHMEEPSYIQFGVSILEGPKTRGAIEPSGNFTGSMSLYGLYSGTTHINGEPVSVSNGRATSTSTWPGNTALRFFTFANNAGLTVTPNNTALSCGIGTYTIATNATAQKDLLFGWVNSHSKSDGEVSFEFQHVLSRLTFKAKQSGFPDNAEVVIKKIQIKNALNALSGDLTDAEAYDDALPNGWNKPSGNRSTVFTMNVREKNLTTTLDTLTAGTIEDYNMFMFPHSNTDFQNAGTPVTLEITYEIGGVPDTYDVELNSLESGTHSWPIGKWTAYEITIKPTGLLLEVDLRDWTDEESDWYFLNRTLNVSQTEVNITDYNGARVYFSSNMPEVKVLEEVYEGTTGMASTAPTNKIFNELSESSFNGGNPYRFYYKYDDDEKKGTGYMDILLDDEINAVGTYTYRIVLAASDSKDSERQLKREIRVNIRQDGVRSTSHFTYGFARFVGVFFRRNETGERIVMEYNSNGPEQGKDNWWTAEVLDPEGTGSWVVISSTPSLDPKIGTNDIGHEQDRAEKYPVTINDVFEWQDKDKLNGKNKEDGKNVRGRGRVYFRVGATGTLPANSENRYATIRLRMRDRGDAPNYDHYTTTNIIYVRQGEAADYIYDRTDVIPSDGHILTGENRNAAVRFSPYNLTAPGFKGLAHGDAGPTEIQLPRKGGVAVKYPSQAGAYFQWFYPEAEYQRYAYSPNRSVNPNPDKFGNKRIKTFSKDLYIGKYWTNDMDPTHSFSYDNELCPPGFHRPSDGPTDVPVANAPYKFTDPDNHTPIGNYSTQIRQSEFRMSLMLRPDAGSGSQLASGYDGGDPIDPMYYIYPSFPYRGGMSYVRAHGNTQTTFPALSNPPALDERPGAINLRYTIDATTLEGFYADGFYDRYPKTNGNPRWTVKDNTTHVAYAGIIFFNETNNKSLFIPYAGRRNINTPRGAPDAFGSSAYLWLASSSPYLNAEYQFLGWRAVLQYRSESTSIGTVQYRFGQSIRCVADNDNLNPIMPQ